MTDKPKKVRVVLDAKGNPLREEQIAPGEFAPVKHDSVALNKLKPDALSLAETQKQRTLHNPYGNSTPSDKRLRSRSGLDYLRALSESIKAKRRIKNEDDDKR